MPYIQEVTGSMEPGTTGYVPAYLNPRDDQWTQRRVPHTPNVFYATLDKTGLFNTINIGIQNVNPGTVGAVTWSAIDYEYQLFWLPLSMINASQVQDGNTIRDTLGTTSPFAIIRTANGGGVQQFQDSDPSHLFGRGWYFAQTVSRLGITSDMVVCAVPYNGSVWESAVPSDVTGAAASWAVVGNSGGGLIRKLNLAFYSPASSNSFIGCEVFVANYGIIGATPASIGLVSCAPGGVTFNHAIFYLNQSTSNSGDNVDVYLCSVSTLGTRRTDPTTGVHLVVTI